MSKHRRQRMKRLRKARERVKFVPLPSGTYEIAFLDFETVENRIIATFGVTSGLYEGHKIKADPKTVWPGLYQ